MEPNFQPGIAQIIVQASYIRKIPLKTDAICMFPCIRDRRNPQDLLTTWYLCIFVYRGTDCRVKSPGCQVLTLWIAAAHSILQCTDSRGYWQPDKAVNKWYSTPKGHLQSLSPSTRCTRTRNNPHLSLDRPSQLLTLGRIAIILTRS